MREVNLKMQNNEDQFENGESALNTFMLSDNFNEYTAMHSIAPAERQDPEQRVTLSRGRAVDLDLMRLRAENPFVPIVEIPDVTHGVTVSAAVPQAVIDIPDGARYVIIGSCGLSGTALNASVISFDSTNTLSLTANGPTAQGIIAMNSLLDHSAIYCYNRKTITVRFLYTTGSAYVSASFYF